MVEEQPLWAFVRTAAGEAKLSNEETKKVQQRGI
jgi:hypothetical protein